MTMKSLGKAIIFYIVLYVTVFYVTRVILRRNKKEYNTTHYYPKNAINI
jgi:hypothetical protein